MINNIDDDDVLVGNNAINKPINNPINNSIDNIKKRGRPRKYTKEDACKIHLKQARDWKEKTKCNVKNLPTNEKVIIQYLMHNPINNNQILREVYDRITGKTLHTRIELL
jgi:hypothetical protein